MKARPILFNSEMVRAILDGKKTQTRRVIKPQPQPRENQPERLDFLNRSGEVVAAMWEPWKLGHSRAGYLHLQDRCPHGQSGDRLWVREKHSLWKLSSVPATNDDATYCCFPDGSQKFRSGKYHNCDFAVNDQAWPSFIKWRPSIFMPRWASRITLEVLKVRVERVQNIQGYDVADELGTGGGLADDYAEDYERFIALWDSINAKRGFGWSGNPWVWVIEFRLLESMDDGE